MVEHNDKTDRGAKMNFFVHAHAAKYVVKILRVCKTVVPRYKLSSGFFVTIVRVGKLLLSFYCLRQNLLRPRGYPRNRSGIL